MYRQTAAASGSQSYPPFSESGAFGVSHNVDAASKTPHHYAVSGASHSSMPTIEMHPRPEDLQHASYSDSSVEAFATGAPSSVSPSASLVSLGSLAALEAAALQGLAAASAPFAAGPSRANKKPKVSHARKTAPGHIKRPPNAFILFRSHCCSPPGPGEEDYDAPGTPTAQQLSVLGINDHRHLSRIASHLWRSLAPSQKKYWEDKAVRKKLEHVTAYPDYRYKPVYRKREEIRKRKVVLDEADIEAEKRACEQVASDLLVSSGAGLLVENADREQSTSGPVTREPSPTFVARTPAAPKLASPARERRSPPTARNPLRNEGQERRDVALAPQQSRLPDSTREKWTLDTVMSAVNNRDVPPPPPPALRVRRPTTGRPRSARQRDTVAEDASGHEATPQVETDFSVHYFDSSAVTTRTSFVRRADRTEETGSAEFDYMNELNNLLAQQQQPIGSIYDYEHALQNKSARAMNASHFGSVSFYTIPLNSNDPTGNGAPGPLQIPHNPVFSFDNCQGFSSDSSPGPLSPGSTPRLQHYFNAPPPPTGHGPPPTRLSGLGALSPTSSTFTFGTAGTESEIHLPLTGMKRRGTLGRATQGGDLMLISPVTGAFGTARKFSLGKWEIRAPEAGHEAAPHSSLGNETRIDDVYDLPPEIAEMLNPSPPLPMHDFSGQLEQIRTEVGANDLDYATDVGRNSHTPSPTSSATSGSRPSTAASDHSSFNDSRRQNFDYTGQKHSILEQWRDAARGPGQTPGPYHVGAHPYFRSPASATHAAPGSSNERSVNKYFHLHPAVPQNQKQADQVPAFDSPGFGGSFVPESHSESLDATKAATTAFYQHHQHFERSANINEHVVRSQWEARRERGSDATIRGRYDSTPASEARRVALEVLQRQLQQPELQIQPTSHLGSEGDEEPGRKYFHLTPDQAKDPVLVDSLLQWGYGVSFDREASGAATAEID